MNCLHPFYLCTFFLGQFLAVFQSKPSKINGNRVFCLCMMVQVDGFYPSGVGFFSRKRQKTWSDRPLFHTAQRNACMVFFWLKVEEGYWVHSATVVNLRVVQFPQFQAVTRSTVLLLALKNIAVLAFPHKWYEHIARIFKIHQKHPALFGTDRSGQVCDFPSLRLADPMPESP